MLPLAVRKGFYTGVRKLIGASTILQIKGLMWLNKPNNEHSGSVKIPAEVITAVLDSVLETSSNEKGTLIINYIDYEKTMQYEHSTESPEDIVKIVTSVYERLKERTRAPDIVFDHDGLEAGILNKKEFTEAILCIPLLLEAFPKKKFKESDAIILLAPHYPEKDNEDLSLFINRIQAAGDIIRISFNLIPETYELQRYELSRDLDINQFNYIKNMDKRTQQMIRYSLHRRQTLPKAVFDSQTQMLLDEYNEHVNSEWKKNVENKILYHFSYLVSSRHIVTDTVDKDDYFQEYALTVHVALMKYNEGKGSFENYVSRAVRNNLLTLYKKNCSDFYIPKRYMTIYGALHKDITAFEAEYGRMPTTSEIITTLGYSLAEFIAYIETKRVVSLDEKYSEGTDSANDVYVPFYHDTAFDTIGEAEYLDDLLSNSGLSAYQRFLLERYVLCEKDERDTLEKLAKEAYKLGLTKSPSYANAQRAKMKALGIVKKYLEENSLF